MNELLNNYWPRIRYVAAIQALELIAIYLDFGAVTAIVASREKSLARGRETGFI